MATNETEERDEVMEKQIRLIQQGTKYGLGAALGGALLCILTMLPVAVMFSARAGETRNQSYPFLIVVSIVVLFGGIGILGVALYKLIPLYIRYRRTKRPDEEMFT